MYVVPVVSSQDHGKALHRPLLILAVLDACVCMFFSRADSSILERRKFCDHKTTPQRYYVAHVCSKHRVGNAIINNYNMPGCDRHDIHIL